jgi:SDR family mycofactocin-dependent oxidoreductase
VALVTGAGRGIGAATVRRLAADDWRVVAIDRGEDDPRLPYPLATAKELRALGGERVLAVRADTCDVEALRAAAEAAEQRWGGLDAVIAAAGVIAGGVPAWELDRGQEGAVLDVTLGGVMAAARACVPALLRRPEPRDGRVIAIASAAATRGFPMLAAYCAAKAGVVGFIRALAVELAGKGVTANTVSPGSTRTAILDETARLYGLESGEAFGAQQPLGRLLEPDEVAALIAWLASTQSRGATGGNFPLDGGLSL